MNIFKAATDKVHEINVRYAHPKIVQSRTVKIALLMLRVYLLLLVLLLLYKFVTVITTKS